MKAAILWRCYYVSGLVAVPMAVIFVYWVLMASKASSLWIIAPNTIGCNRTKEQYSTFTVTILKYFSISMVCNLYTSTPQHVTPLHLFYPMQIKAPANPPSYFHSLWLIRPPVLWKLGGGTLRNQTSCAN